MTRVDDDSDAALVSRSLAGDQRAFAILVGRYKRYLYAIIVRLVGDPDEALDLLQEAFVSAHAALRRYDPDRPLRGWLARIALNKARDWRRKERVRAALRALLPIGEGQNVADDAALPDRQLADRSELIRVERKIAGMPARLREVLLLRMMDELSQAEVAELLAISEKAVETRLYRARRYLLDAG